jgi:hypothetical protein
MTAALITLRNLISQIASEYFFADGAGTVANFLYCDVARLRRRGESPMNAAGFWSGPAARGFVDEGAAGVGRPGTGCLEKTPIPV